MDIELPQAVIAAIQALSKTASAPPSRAAASAHASAPAGGYDDSELESEMHGGDQDLSEQGDEEESQTLLPALHIAADTRQSSEFPRRSVPATIDCGRGLGEVDENMINEANLCRGEN